MTEYCPYIKYGPAGLPSLALRRGSPPAAAACRPARSLRRGRAAASRRPCALCGRVQRPGFLGAAVGPLAVPWPVLGANRASAAGLKRYARWPRFAVRVPRPGSARVLVRALRRCGGSGAARPPPRVASAPRPPVAPLARPSVWRGCGAALRPRSPRAPGLCAPLLPAASLGSSASSAALVASSAASGVARAPCACPAGAPPPLCPRSGFRPRGRRGSRCARWPRLGGVRPPRAFGGGCGRRILVLDSRAAPCYSVSGWGGVSYLESPGFGRAALFLRCGAGFAPSRPPPGEADEVDVRFAGCFGRCGGRGLAPPVPS